MQITKRPARTAPSPLSDLKSWFDDFFHGELETPHLPKAFSTAFVPALNLLENGGEFVATIELPGMEEEDLEVQVLGRQLVVSGERKWKHEDKEGEFHRVESHYGSFRRAIALPEGALMDADRIHATFKQGMLEIRVPKTEPKAASRVRVTTT